MSLVLKNSDFYLEKVNVFDKITNKILKLQF